MFVKRLYETKKYKIYVTGSSSKMLSKEIATELRGRSLPINVFPLSFKEYLKFKNIDIKDEVELIRNRHRVLHEFRNYMIYGGFPEIVNEELKYRVLNTYIDLIVYKDVIERYKIKNLELLKNLIKHLSTNIAKEFSVNSYFNFVKNSFYVSRDTISEYLGYLQDIQFVFLVPMFSYSFKKQLVNPKKIYCIDTGLANSVSFKFSEDKGRMLENLVFIELKRRGKEVFYHKGKGHAPLRTSHYYGGTGKECDFVIREGMDIVEAIQVVASLEDYDTRKREVSGLIDALKTYDLKEGLILTEDEEDEFEEKGFMIKVKPIWKWLLQ